VGKVMKRSAAANISNRFRAGLRGFAAEISAIGYSASKGGVVIFTKDWRANGACTTFGECIAQLVPTDMSEKVIERNRERCSRVTYGTLWRMMNEGRRCFFASDASDFVNRTRFGGRGSQSA